MKNELFLLAVHHETNGSIPSWEVIATDTDYKKIILTFNSLVNECVLLHWQIMKGVQIIRANLESFKMGNDWSNLEMPFDNIATYHRAGLYLPVYNTILTYMNT